MDKRITQNKHKNKVNFVFIHSPYILFSTVIASKNFIFYMYFRGYTLWVSNTDHYWPQHVAMMYVHRCTQTTGYKYQTAQESYSYYNSIRTVHKYYHITLTASTTIYNEYTSSNQVPWTVHKTAYGTLQYCKNIQLVPEALYI